LTQLRSVPAPDSTNLEVVDAPEADVTTGAAIPRAERPRYSNTEDTDILPRTPQHRRQPTSAARGRVLIAAMAVGATAAAAYTTMTAPHEVVATTRTVLASERAPMEGMPGAELRGVQLIAVTPVADAAVHAEELARGVAYAAERAVREARLQRPLFVQPARGLFTSGFGYRWGALHDGIDLAGPIGTPIYAATDGIVKEAGPTNSGYGAWVLIRHSDGTVTRYGHINTWDVQVGQRVFAGDQIATIGNRGNSTGPHLHFSVLLGGNNPTDPVSWLAAHGVSIGGYVG
jgi:murein DD-endopeptidase MepM/ murein hydrolase activator NlpD